MMTKTATDESLKLHARAAIIPGRSLTRSKAPGRLFDERDGPLYAHLATGATLVDVNDNSYIDMVCALGAISLGYGGSTGRLAEDMVRAGWVFSLPHHYEVQAAERLLEHVAPWASHVRFVKTGSEATHGAYRIAKAATGRRHVLVGDWAYHGWHEWVDQALKFPHGSLEIRQPVGQNDVAWGDVAAVFIEPHRWEPVDVEWLRSVRAFCDRNGSLLIFDEMIYGGRWALGGATEYFGVTPDLACYGKAIGNGAPIACIVGRDAMATHGELVSGTYSGDAAALGAVIEVVRTYAREPVIDTLWKRGSQLARGLREAVSLCPGEVTLEGQPVHQRLRFVEPAIGKRFAAAMARRGVLWHPDVVNVSYAHTEALIERVVEAALASMQEMRGDR